MFFFLNQIAYGSFIKIPNPLKQFPVDNLIISEARLKWICFKELLQIVEFVNKG